MPADPASGSGASPATAAPRSSSGRRWRDVRPAVLVTLVVIAALTAAADQAIKNWALGALAFDVPNRIIGDLLIFRRVDNPGAAFSLASGSTWLFSVIAVAVVVFLVGFAPRIRRVVWGVLFGLLLGGTLGNLIDRLTRPPGFGVGHVVDYIQIPLLPAIFNSADVAIVTSMCLFVLLTVLGVSIDGSKPHRKRD